MRPVRKKEKMAGGNNTIPGATVGNGSSNGTAMSSGRMAGVSSSAKQETISYNACPPPPNLYGPPTPLAVSCSDKVKGSFWSGNTSDGEKKGRRRPGRKSRQVADSSAFPLTPNDTSIPAGKSPEVAALGQLSPDPLKQLKALAHLPSPSPSSMPSPNFKTNSVSDVPSSAPVAAKPSTGAESKHVDQISVDKTLVKPNFQSQQCGSSSKVPIVLDSLPQNASCTVESGTALEDNTKDILPIGIPKLKSKEMSKSSKSNPASCPKKWASLGSDSKQLCQKGWRMCSPSGTTPNSCSGSFDVSASCGSPCEGVGRNLVSGLNHDGGLPQIPHSFPEASVLASSGPPDKLVNGGNSGHGMSRSSHFSEHLSPEDASHFMEAGNAFRGVLRVNPHYRSEAYVTLEGVPVDILIDGLLAQNRGMEGDVVAIQLNPASQWSRLKGTNKQNSASGADESIIKGAVSTENEVISASDDMAMEHEYVPNMGCPSVSGYDSDLRSSKEANGGNRWLASSPSSSSGNGETAHRDDLIGSGQGLSPIEVDEKKGSNSIIQHLRRQGLARNGNLDADRSKSEMSLASLAVLLQAMPGKRPTGRVVAILGKSVRREAVIGYLDVQGSNCAGRSYNSGNDLTPQKTGKKSSSRTGGSVFTFLPIDNRFPKMVVLSSGIPEPLSKRLKDGDLTVSSELVVAQVEGWKADSALPRASLKQSLGSGGTIEAQTAAILLENAVHSADFSESCFACLPDVPWKIPEKEVKKRKDLRGLRIFTIDPPTAKDLDDALSFEQLDNGIVRIGVHIADVSFFVQPDTALDKEAQKRSTSVYLIQQVLPMLPTLLCEELCSLNPGVDRLAFSVMWTMDPEGNILDQWIGRTIICSCAKLTYVHAQGMIDDTFLELDDWKCPETSSNGAGLPLLHGEHSWPELIADVQKLHEVARRRRESRFDGGALKLENSRLVFTLDEDGEPYDSIMYQHQDSNFLVEEFMLLANMTVARVISSAFPERALLRRHPEPNVRKLKEFQDFCSKNGFELDTSSSGALHLSLEKLRESFQDDPVLFNILMLYATKPMQLAKYFCTGDLKGQEDDWAHYALAVPLYTHFTSPIRRYPDLVVHRTVAAALEVERVLTVDGSLSGGRVNRREVAGNRSLQCFSGATVDKDISDTDVAQKALLVAAKKHKLPELSELSLVAAHCNERRLASRNVKDASDKLYLWSMLKRKQGVLSSARVLALGPKFMSLYVCKIAMERRIYYDEIDGLNAEWFEATGTLVLNLSTERVIHKKFGLGSGKPQRTVADVALLVNPTDSISSNLDGEAFEDLIREVEDRLAGKIIVEDESVVVNKGGSDMEVEPAVLPLTLRWFSSVPVSIHAIGGENRPLDIAVRLYVSSYST